MQNKQTTLMLKKQISFNVSVPPPYFVLATRKYNIFYCQLRNLASNLNQHKFLSHLPDSSRCPCVDDVEDNFLYFYVCRPFIWINKRNYGRMAAIPTGNSLSPRSGNE